MSWTFYIIFFLACAVASAEDITLSDGTVYKNATVLKHDAVNATIVYADGGATVPIAKLPAAIQASLGYDPAAAQAKVQLEQKAREDELSRRRAQEVMLAGGRIRQVLPEGLVIELSTKGPARKYLGLSLVRCDTNGLIADKHWEGKIWPDGGFMYDDGSGEKSVLPKYTAIESEALEPGGK